ncbi:hypothetical protein AB0K05_29275 [Nonomuraea sp. NPDC049486]|uniref:hypothetical protein n=1 Tax=Nonomuraea sp. NPDC049486 TaxID=3155773 RepID=UPI00341E196C
MADGAGENIDESKNDVLDVIWMILGAIVGVVLVTKYVQFARLTHGEKVSVEQGIFALGLFVAPCILSTRIAEIFRIEALRGRMSWGTYWTVLSGMAASIFTFLGVTGIDDIVQVLEYWSSLPKGSP